METDKKQQPQEVLIPLDKILDIFKCPAKLRLNVLRNGPVGYDLYSEEEIERIKKEAVEEYKMKTNKEIGSLLAPLVLSLSDEFELANSCIRDVQKTNSAAPISAILTAQERLKQLCSYFGYIPNRKLTGWAKNNDEK